MRSNLPVRNPSEPRLSRHLACVDVRLTTPRFRRVGSGQYPPLLPLLPPLDVALCVFPSDGHPVKASDTTMRNADNSLVAFIMISCGRDQRAHCAAKGFASVIPSRIGHRSCRRFLVLWRTETRLSLACTLAFVVAAFDAQQSTGGGRSPRRITRLRLVNVRRSHNIPFRARKRWARRNRSSFPPRSAILRVESKLSFTGFA